MPGRNYTQPNNNYRYGFNGKEKDNKDGVVQYDYGFRIYDPRLVRFKSVDPLFKGYPWNSTYAFAEGDMIRSIDLDGLEKKIVTITSSYEITNSKLVLTTSTKTDNDARNVNNLGKGTLYINVLDTRQYNANGTVTGNITTKINYEPQSIPSKILDFFTGQTVGGDNKFGFVYTSKSDGGSTLGIGNANVQFGQTLDIDVLIQTVGAIRDVAPDKSSLTDFITSGKVKALYDIIDASMKLGGQLADDADKLFPINAPTTPNTTTPTTTPENTKPKPVVQNKSVKGKWQYATPDGGATDGGTTSTEIKPSNNPGSPDTLVRTHHTKTPNPSKKQN